MTLYEFWCEDCGMLAQFFHTHETIKGMKHECEACGGVMHRAFSPPKIKVSFRPGHDPYTGQNFGTQAERDAFIADNGLMKVGDNDS